MMLHRLRNAVRRWPRLCLLLALGSFATQGVAGTLAWCLHGSADPHVMSAVEPCHGEAPAPVHPHCHGAPVHSHATHVALASDGLLSAPPALPPAAPLLFSSFPLSLESPDDALRPPARGATRSGAPPGQWPPRISGAVPGQSSRLLI